MITLTFRPLQGEVATLARGAYFRICADGTLRGPDNEVAARYADRRWQLGQRHYREFECSGNIFLRVTDHEDQLERLGPYDYVRAAEGALFSRHVRLGTHSPGTSHEVATYHWREVALLSEILKS